jgi:hypothetical protein
LKLNGVCIESLGVHLPEWVAVSEAEGVGDYRRGEFAAAGLTGTHVAGDVPAVDLAVLAARSAVGRAAADLEVAIGQVTGVAQRSNVLLTTAANFSTPLTNRWGDFGTSSNYSDGTVAAVVNGRGGFAEVLSLTSGTPSSLEQWHRGQESLLPPDGSPPEVFRHGGAVAVFRRQCHGFRRALRDLRAVRPRRDQRLHRRRWSDRTTAPRSDTPAEPTSSSRSSTPCVRVSWGRATTS